MLKKILVAIIVVNIIIFAIICGIYVYSISGIFGTTVVLALIALIAYWIKGGISK